MLQDQSTVRNGCTTAFDVFYEMVALLISNGAFLLTKMEGQAFIQNAACSTLHRLLRLSARSERPKSIVFYIALPFTDAPIPKIFIKLTYYTAK